MANLAIAGIFFVAIAGGVGLGVASADPADELAQAGAFGFDEETHVATQAAALNASSAVQADAGASGQQVLASTSSRDISAGLEMVDEREAAEKAQAEADKKAAVNRVVAEKAKQGVEDTTTDGTVQGDSQSSAKEETIDEYNLTAVDWSVGKKAFIVEWGARIDAYLKGTELAGYGETFAEAAWDNGVDPRWSPAISNTESGNGANCFLPYNAWGWGDYVWSDWDTAIRAHVAGLAERYGYSVTYAMAQTYCPPNSVHWYNNTLAQMALI